MVYGAKGEFMCEFFGVWELRKSVCIFEISSN